MSKLNMSYRSDRAAVAGDYRAAGGGARAGSNRRRRGSRICTARGGCLGADSLIGQAISTPISSRLQRFFGVSRLKIDPHLTGTEISPQARLTVNSRSRGTSP